VASLQGVAEKLDVRFFLMGAAARDVMIRHAHNLDTGRGTTDVDFAVAIDRWETWRSLRDALLRSGEFVEWQGRAEHRLRHRSGLPLDLVPFGGVERLDRTLVWPPDNVEVFNCFGMDEAYKATVEVKLPRDVVTRVASLPALAILKIAAWADRKQEGPRDAPDLILIARRYLDCGNFDRLCEQHADLLETDRFDYEYAGAQLLARDMIPLLDREAIARLSLILSVEADEEGPLLLAAQSGTEPETARRLIQAMCDELRRALEGQID
jgi:predicted nucleotidyltransferase